MEHPRLKLEYAYKDKWPVYYVQQERLIGVCKENTWNVVVRAVGEFAGQGYSLAADYDWVIGEDSFGVLCLIPLRKGEG